jgi:di/tricarboxylate transporter
MTIESKEDKSVVPKQADSKLRGIFFMNMFCLGNVVVSSLFKGLAKEGVSCFDFAVLRAGVGLLCISLVNWYN